MCWVRQKPPLRLEDLSWENGGVQREGLVYKRQALLGETRVFGRLSLHYLPAVTEAELTGDETARTAVQNYHP